MAGSTNCKVEIKKSIIKKMQTDCRVGRQKALQILAREDGSPRSNHQTYPTHFRCKMGPETKSKFNPWTIDKSFTQEIGTKRATIRSTNDSEFFIENTNENNNKFFKLLRRYVLHTSK